MSSRLADARLLLVTGKGGVGKSTVSAALACALAERGRRVLLVELGARPVMGELLKGQSPRHTPSVIAQSRFPTLWVSHLNAQKALQEYLAETLKVRSLARLATENKVLARLWQAAPSVDEMAILTALERFEAETDPDHPSRPRFDHVVVDLPATGHARAMLSVPRGTLGMIRVGALADRAKQVDRLLHDRRKTSLVIVTLPEELPINETVQLSQVLEDELDVETAAVVINAVLPQVFDKEESELVAALVERIQDAAGQRLLAAATQKSTRQVRQGERISRLKDSLDTEFIEVGFESELGHTLIERIAGRFRSTFERSFVPGPEAV
ncbi:MAG: ArsA family ATPase [Myxococcota bacterium]